MIANGVSENVVKTLTHSLLPEHRRYQSCASMHAAARHRDCNHLWPMDDTDFAWASRERREKGLNHWSYESNESRSVACRLMSPRSRSHTTTMTMMTPKKAMTTICRKA